jgi:uncharacterized membrane-anchored protein YjiN (DUF445 family)
MSVTMNDTLKAKQLRSHKLLATGLFVAMMLLYIFMTWLAQSNSAGWIGYVRAFAEAAMVGALADWFAVTALFHHPFGIPIPHTNLIEASKKSIGDNLGNFVVSNFLTPATIRPYIQKIEVSVYVAQWLEKPSNRQALISEATYLLKDIVGRLDDASITAFIEEKGKAMIAGVELNKMAAKTLNYLVEKGEHEGLVTLLAGKIKDYIRQNEGLVQEKVKAESYFFIPNFVDKKLAEKITSGLYKYFEEIELDKAHRLRDEITVQLHQFVHDLQTQPRWKNELDELKEGLLSADTIHQYSVSIWRSLKVTLLKELSANDSTLKKQFEKLLQEMADNLAANPNLRGKIDGWLRFNAYKYILRNTQQVGNLISNTIGNWEGKELSRKLELEVGKDLQFIRINGTIVGGLVGTLIHFITELV